MLASKSTTEIDVPQSARRRELGTFCYEERKLAQLLTLMLGYEGLLNIEDDGDYGIAMRTIAEVIEGKLKVEGDEGAWELHLLWIDRN